MVGTSIGPKRQRRSSTPRSQNKKGRLSHSFATKEKSSHRGSLIFEPGAHNAVDLVASKFGLLKEHAEGAVLLSKSLKVDDPGVFVTFQPGPRIRTHLARNLNGRPCLPGANGPQALHNLKEWVRSSVPEAKRQFIFESGEMGMGIGNLTQEEFNNLQTDLSFTIPIPLSPWVAIMATNGYSLGGLIGVTGTGVGQATMCNIPSNVFSD